ncbi:hypothetical protein [Bacillus pumilus]|uniref:hypothetical protein n=1 Tax=Bacillus pumilus TaxID=1408 RepID=UPI0021125971|nr:hypothetical protein [Bacillus pumilus]UUD44612.1 hypothetical protein NPA43_18940 [Bacillus pumilus]
MKKKELFSKEIENYEHKLNDYAKDCSHYQGEDLRGAELLKSALQKVKLLQEEGRIFVESLVEHRCLKAGAAHLGSELLAICNRPKVMTYDQFKDSFEVKVTIQKVETITLTEWYEDYLINKANDEGEMLHFAVIHIDTGSIILDGSISSVDEIVNRMKEKFYIVEWN